MPPRRHHDEIGAAFIRCMKNLLLDVPLDVDLSPPPRLTLRHYDFREAVFLADVEQRDGHSVTSERVGE
jgi:hypothetical protein